MRNEQCFDTRAFVSVNTSHPPPKKLSAVQVESVTSSSRTGKAKFKRLAVVSQIISKRFSWQKLDLPLFPVWLQ